MNYALLFAFLWLLAVHFIGDFVLQSHWMSINKSKRNDALAGHVAIYTVTLGLGAAPLMILWHSMWWATWIVGNGLAHFATDYITSRINARLWTKQRVHDFFVGVGADQLIHSLTLGLSLAWVSSL